MLNAESFFLVVMCFLATMLILVALFSYIDSYEALWPIKLVVFICLILSILLFIILYFAPDSFKPTIYYFFGLPNIIIGSQKLIIFIITPENRLIVEIYRCIGICAGMYSVKNLYKRLREEIRNKNFIKTYAKK